MAAAAEALESVYGQPVAVSAVRGARSPAPPPPPPPRRGRGGTRVAPILGAIGTGVGVIGFVTFIGGVTVYARLRAAGFPAAPALGIFPSQDLVVIGAQTLVPEVLWALGGHRAGRAVCGDQGQHITVEDRPLCSRDTESMTQRLLSGPQAPQRRRSRSARRPRDALRGVRHVRLRRARARRVDLPGSSRARRQASAVRAGPRPASLRSWPPPWAASRGASSIWPRRRSSSSASS